jgi:hypothetical protein
MRRGRSRERTQRSAGEFTTRWSSAFAVLARRQAGIELENAALRDLRRSAASAEAESGADTASGEAGGAANGQS